MSIKSLEIRTLAIPFKTSFKHSSAERKVTQSIIVEARSNSNFGYGEACPREYVTHENIESAIQFFNLNKSAFLQLDNLEKLKNWVKSNENSIHENPAAWCAVELAILELLAKDRFMSVEGLLDLPELSEEFKYSAILGDSTLEVTESQIAQFAKFGLNDFKFKISGNLGEDNQKINMIKAKVPNCTIRIDANNLWKNSKEAIAYLEEISEPVIAIEEPLNPFDYRGMTEIYEKLGIPIILDESFLNDKHFDPLLSNPKAFIINLRISKMGGILRSLQIAKKATELNIPIIVGAQVGETSILTRAALLIVNCYRSNIIFQEGAYGTLLLTQDIVKKPVMFGAYGVLDPKTFLDKSEFGFQMVYEF